MADLFMSCCGNITVNNTVVISGAITGGGGGSGAAASTRRVLVRTGDTVPANTAIDLNTPGLGWSSSGDTITLSGSNDFVDNTQLYANGVLQLLGLDASNNDDAYFVAGNAIAFEYPVIKNDVIQIWRFTAAS